MRRLCLLVAVTMVALPNIASGQEKTVAPPLPSVALPPDLDRVLRDYEQAWKASDANGVAALFADGRVIVADMDRSHRR